MVDPPNPAIEIECIDNNLSMVFDNRSELDIYLNNTLTLCGQINPYFGHLSKSSDESFNKFINN